MMTLNPNTWLKLNPKEFIKVRTAFLYFACVMAAFITLKSARNAQFLSKVGIDQLPYLYLVMGFSLSLAAGGIGRLIRGMSMSDVVTKLLTFAIGISAIFWVISLENPGRWFYWIFYLWVGMVGYVLSIYGWLLWNEWFTVRDARKLYWMIGLGGLIGAFLGGLVSGLFVNTFGEGSLIPLSLLYLSLGLILLKRSQSHFPHLWKSFSPTLLNLPRPESRLKLLKKSPFLLLILGSIFLTEFASTWIEFILHFQVQQKIPSSAGMATFFSGFYSLTNLTALLLQVFVTRIMVRKFGLRWTLFILPAVLLILTLGLPFGLGIMSVAILAGFDGGARHTINRTSFEILYLPIPKQLKEAFRGPYEAIAQRSGMALAGAGILVALRLFSESGIWQVVVLWIFLTASLFACHKLYTHYVKSLKSSFKMPQGRRLRGLNPSMADPELKSQIKETLNSQDESEVLGALEFVEFLGEKKLLTIELAKHPSSKVRQKTLELLRDNVDPSTFRVARMLLNDPVSEVRAQAIAVVYALDKEKGSRLISPHLYSPNPVTRAQAAACLAQSDDSYGVDASKVIQEMCKSENPEFRKEGALASASLKTKDSLSVLTKLLQDSDRNVIKNAIQSAGQVQETSHIPQLLKLSKVAELKTSVIAAIENYGALALNPLEQILLDLTQSQDIRTQVPFLLRYIPVPQTIKILHVYLTDRDVPVRFQALKTLNRIRRDYPALKVDKNRIRAAIIFESKFYHHYRHDLSQLKKLNLSRTPHRLLLEHLSEHLEWTVERIFRLVGMIQKQNDIYNAYLTYRSSSQQLQANSIEFLDNVLDQALRGAVLPVVERDLENSDIISQTGLEESKEILLEMLEHNNRVTVALSLQVLNAFFPETRGQWANFSKHADPLLREAAA